uniref:Uncharacterized protein n=1 Tax=Panagrolaimus sp. ES5 TaxID=591445 RepID=A0AC34GWL3_9BILA
MQQQQQHPKIQTLPEESSSSSGHDNSDGDDNLGNLSPAELSFINDTIDKLMRAPLKLRRGGAKGELVQKASRTKPLAPDVDVMLTKSDILQICELASDSFLKQKSLIEIKK